jgi:hypothetical protein
MTFLQHFISYFILRMYLFLPTVRSSSITIIPSTAHTNLTLILLLSEGKLLRCLATFKQSNVLLGIGSSGKEKCFHVVFKLCYSFNYDLQKLKKNQA